MTASPATAKLAALFFTPLGQSTLARYGSDATYAAQPSLYLHDCFARTAPPVHS